MYKPTLLSFFVAASAVDTIDAFGGSSFHPSSSLVVIAGPSSSSSLSPILAAGRGKLRPPRLLLRAYDESSSDELLSLLSNDADDDDNGNGNGTFGATDDLRDEDAIKSAIATLESSFISSSSSDSDSDGNDGDDESGDSRFDPLIGLYEVKSVLTTKEGDNPVGGKWTRKNGLVQKLFRTRTTFQHLLPLDSNSDTAPSTTPKEAAAAVAQAVNVVSLDALDGLLRVTVVLRGDAVPLSLEERLQTNANRTKDVLTDLAVRASFDPPRIYLGRRRRRRRRKKGGSGGEETDAEARYSYLPLQIGPSSSVVLDTTYYDERLRVGMGGTSGTRFVFARTAAEEAREYEALLDLPSSGRSKGRALAGLGGTLVASLCVAFGRGVGVGKLAAYASKAGRIVAGAKFTASVLGLLRGLRPWAMVGARIVAGVTSVVSGIALLLILFSSGGIERDGMSPSPSPPS